LPGLLRLALQPLGIGTLPPPARPDRRSQERRRPPRPRHRPVQTGREDGWRHGPLREQVV